MRLRSIELAGFKSFADRTTIRFEPGMTGIVGPNGCGKSNIVDALKWVLGTLSYKSVRGEEMMDVIFKGAEGIGPSGFAEVRLTFENQDRTLALDVDEVCISRRLYRSGESQYLINGAECRRRDVRELFFGTGVGADTYSIIEQGKINRLILASAQERRGVFDEAAGVSKYRARKKEAEAKLQRVEQDLLRLDDRVADASRDLHSLRVQAGRAARYKELADALRDKSLIFLTGEAAALEARRLEALGNAEVCRAERAALDEALAQVRGGLADAREALTEAERARERVRADEGRVEERREHFRLRLAQSEARLAEIAADRERGRGEREAAEARLRGIDEKTGRAVSERGAAHVAREAARQAVEEHERRAAEAVRECTALEARVEAQRAEILELARKETGLRNDITQAERDLEQLRAREARLAEKTQKLESDLGEMRVRQDELGAQLSGLRKAMVERRNDKKGLDREMEGLREAFARAQGECNALRADRERLTARLETLREIELNREGMGSGVRALLAAPAGASGDARGTVADLVEVPLPYAPAIEAALGDAATYVVVPDAAAARRAADYVRANQLDRTGIAALDGPAPSPRSAPEHPAVVGRAVDLVRPADEACGLLARLLGDTLVVREPIELDRPVVTLSGELIRPDGTRVVAGTAEPGGVITRRAEVKALTGEAASLDGRVRAIEDELGALRGKMKDVGVRIDAMRNTIDEGTLREGELSGEEQQLERRFRLAADERRSVDGERREIDRERQLQVERHARASQLVEETAAAAQAARTELERMQEQGRSFARERERIEAALGQIRGEVVKGDETIRALDRQIEEYETGRVEAEAARSRLAEAEAELTRRDEEVRRERDGAETARVAFEKDHEGFGERVRATEAALADVRTRVEQGERAEQDRHGALAQNDEQLRSLEGALREENVRLEHLTLRLREEFQTTPAELASRPAPAEPVDRAALAAEVEELKAKIARFGPVNVLALDRLKEVEDKVGFLKGQQEDLRESRAKLQKLIVELNQEASKRFDETLARVRENFNETFRKLFGGGKADIVIDRQEGVDPMDWGVEIVARPPKKEITTLSLLSGGEQSLTAIALVMALFQSNPSPFCVLDEADHALDENNVGRYAALVQDFVQKTQVIVITHNKRTMAAADTLYGVSMERAGVTKIVNVDFKKIAAPAQSN